MESSEPAIESFLIKIWIDPATQPSWHGYITHVPGEERRYLNALDELPTFIEPYLIAAGATVNSRKS